MTEKLAALGFVEPENKEKKRGKDGENQIDESLRVNGGEIIDN